MKSNMGDSDSEFAALMKQCITSLYLCAENVSKYMKEDEKENEYNRLRECVKVYCELEAQEEVAFQALEKARNETNASNMDNLEERYNNHLSSLAEKRLNVDRHPYMLELNKKIEASLQGARVPENLDISDLAITEAREEYIDPITKKPIVDPVKNTVCAHIYEKESIFNLIKMQKRTKCPVAGCGNREPITEKELVSDEELKFRMTITQHSTMKEEKSILDLDCTAK